MALIRKNFYVPALQQRSKKWIRGCVKCMRMKDQTVEPKNADLPMERVSPSFVFEDVGTDPCGPFQTKSGILQNSKPMNAYVVIFVYMSTKAPHLEISTNLTTKI